MAYSQSYSNLLKEINEHNARINAQIEENKKKLDDLNTDYKTLLECKQGLAMCSALLKDLDTQCNDIKRIFNRAAIEEKYYAYQVTFNNKEIIFEYLDKIGESTENFQLLSEGVKESIDKKGTSLDDSCIDISNEAKVVSNTINNLRNSFRAPTVYDLDPGNSE